MKSVNLTSNHLASKPVTPTANMRTAEYIRASITPWLPTQNECMTCVMYNTGTGFTNYFMSTFAQYYTCIQINARMYVCTVAGKIVT